MIKDITVADESYLFYGSYDQVMQLLEKVRKEYDPNVLTTTYPYAMSMAVAVTKLCKHVLDYAPSARDIYLANLDELSQAAADHFANLINA